MIGKLTGRIDYRASDHVVLDVQGVGYVIHCNDRVMAALPARGEYAALYTHLLVQETNLQLFGFTSLLEKEWHRLLISVQGIGAKASLAILGTLGADGVSRAIALGDWNAVKAAPGVGPKIAQRVVNELKDKAPAVMALGGAGMADAGGFAPAASDSADKRGDEDVIEPVANVGAGDTGSGNASAQADALSALSNLGYGPGEAAAAVAEAAGETGGADAATLIREALRRLAPV